MKKIPTLFVKKYDGNRYIGVSNEVTPGFEWVINGEGTPTVKWDGACCCISSDGEFYKRYDAKKGKKPPVNAIPCCEPDPITGHWPHWVPVDDSNPGDKWFVEAFKNSSKYEDLEAGTYEAVGPHFHSNPYKLDKDVLVRHGIDHLVVVRDFESIKEFLTENYIEGIVFWKDGEPQCKIKRKDFGLSWPIKCD